VLDTLVLLLLVVAVFSLAAVLAAERTTPPPYRVGRSVVMAAHGMVATSQPLAAQVGLEVLQSGGNAVDAAIATNAALGLMEPMSCGIGGDLYALVWEARTGKLHALNASGRSPYQATRRLFADRDLAAIPDTGPLSWSVPGCVDGWDQLRRRFGSRSFAQLLGPAIRYAEAGFPVSEVIADSWRAAEPLLRAHADSARTYLIDGAAPRAGAVFRNANLARSYRALAEHGPDVFYKGALARDIVAFSEKNGGLFTRKDFEDHTSTWVEPVSTTYRGHEVWQVPPPGQGIAVLQMLNLLEGYDLRTMGPEAPAYWHRFVEAKKLAYADRARFYADPDFARVPVAELISKPYAERRRQLIDPDRALTHAEPGDPKLGSGDTVYLCVVDRDRNCVSLIQSLYHGFGSALVPGDLGFALQNRGTLFALDPEHPNRLEPHKRPFHTIIPGFVTRDGKPWLVFGVMGGDMQPQGQVAVLCNLIDFDMNAQQAGEAPRVQHLGSATPTGQPASAAGGTVAVEDGIATAVVEGLTRRGHHVVHAGVNGGGYQGILIDPQTNVLHGGSEPRKDGCAVGY
jgi:gamma-glutamyltranspeptidase/glutathione hydrolase